MDHHHAAGYYSSLARAAAHLAKAARYLGRASRALQHGDGEVAPASPSSSDGRGSAGDPELASPSPDGAAAFDPPVVTGDGDDDDDEEFVLLAWEHGAELATAVAVVVPPLPLHRMLPARTTQGAGWTWFLLAYGVVVTAVGALISVRAFRGCSRSSSSSCLAVSLRAALLLLFLVAEVYGAAYLLPRTTLAWLGSYLTVAHLVIAHLLAWSPCCRRRRR